MTDDHKVAVAAGRDESRKVRLNLEACENTRPKRGRKRTGRIHPGSDDRHHRASPGRITAAAPGACQERVNLQRELDGLAETVDLGQLEQDVVSSAEGYSKRNGTSYTVWQEGACLLLYWPRLGSPGVGTSCRSRTPS